MHTPSLLSPSPSFHIMPGLPVTDPSLAPTTRLPFFPIFLQEGLPRATSPLFQHQYPSPNKATPLYFLFQPPRPFRLTPLIRQSRIRSLAAGHPLRAARPFCFWERPSPFLFLAAALRSAPFICITGIPASSPSFLFLPL